MKFPSAGTSAFSAKEAAGLAPDALESPISLSSLPGRLTRPSFPIARSSAENRSRSSQNPALFPVQGAQLP